MSKIPVKITDDAVAAGKADYAMLYPLKADLVVVPTERTEANVAGGVLAVTTAVAAALGIGDTQNNLDLEDGSNFLLEDGSLLLLE